MFLKIEIYKLHQKMIQEIKTSVRIKRYFILYKFFNKQINKNMINSCMNDKLFHSTILKAKMLSYYLTYFKLT
jgi:hypothetical protein